MFFESSDGSFCGIDTMVVVKDKLDVYFLGPDILFNSVGPIVVHHVQCWLVIS